MIIINMKKELQRLEEGPKVNIHVDSIRATLKRHQIGKRQAMMACMDTSLKDSLPSTTHKLSKWKDDWKK